MNLLSNKELLESTIDDCLDYLRRFKAEMNRIKELGRNKDHNKLEIKYKKQKALVFKYKNENVVGFAMKCCSCNSIIGGYKEISEINKKEKCINCGESLWDIKKVTSN